MVVRDLSDVGPRLSSGGKSLGRTAAIRMTAVAVPKSSIPPAPARAENKLLHAAQTAV